MNSGPAPSLGVYSAGNDQNISNRYKHITDHHDMNHLTINRSAEGANHDYIRISHQVNVGSFNHSTYHHQNNTNNNKVY